MAKILLVSDNNEKIKHYDEVLTGFSHEFLFATNDQMFFDAMNADVANIIILDANSASIDLPKLYRKINSLKENLIILALISDDKIPPELLNVSDAFLTEPVADSVLISTINVNLRRKDALTRLSTSNQNLSKSLYQLDVLYNLGSQLSATLDKEKLINIMLEGLDKALGFSVACVLTFKSDNEPLLIINSINQISDRLLEALKLRAVLNYKSLFENKEMPFTLNIDDLKTIKYAKNPIDDYDFSVLRYDNMFAQINLSENFFGFVEIYRENVFTNEDAQCFHTIAQQVSMPLKNASYVQEIKEKNIELYRLEHLKSEFVSIVSHELRTPITPLKTSLQIILSGRAGEVTPEMSRFLAMANKNIECFSKIINDLLDMSKIEAGKMDYKFAATNIEKLIEFVKLQQNNVATEKGLELSTTFDNNFAYVFADSSRLQQVLNNLISNAIKFTKSGGKINISTKIIDAKDIKCAECFYEQVKHLEGKYLQVCVRDEGIGIEEENLAKVFDQFKQLESSLSREVGGTGLGLPIVRKILDAHNGAIWADSKINEGSSFYFVLPVATDKSNFWILHKQLIQQAKVNKTKFITLTISSQDDIIQNLLNEENLINRTYLNNSVVVKEEDKTSLTMVIPDGDECVVDFLKRKIDTVVLNDKARYGKCDIIYSYTTYPKEKD
ncbi:MAG: ATP-binding protein [Candidatus Gastranaerophilaceae bacterium]